jgi:hypothetical protein
MRTFYLFCVIGVILTLTSCQKENISNAPSQPVAQAKTGQLKVASDFNWKTFKDVLITITGTSNTIVQVVSSNKTVYQKAFLAKGQPYTMKLTVPSYETSVHILYLNQDVNLKLSSGNITYKFN